MRYDGFDYTQPGSVFWASADGRVEIVRHTDGVFELLCCGEPVMPCGTFRAVSDYVWAEFPPF